MTILKTKRLVLRPIRRGDEPSFVKYLNNKRVNRYLVLPPFPYTMKHARAWVELNIKNDKKKKKAEVVFVIENADGFVGAIGLHGISGHKCALGYWIAEPFWGHGFATEAARAMTKFGFKTLNLRRIAASTRLPNKASMKVLEKCGYKKEGHLRKALLKDGRFHDLYLFSKIN